MPRVDDTLAVPRVVSALTAAQLAPSVATLQRYLAQQRWFRAADKQATAMTLQAAAPVGEDMAWAQVRVEHPGHTALYQLPLVLCAADAVPERAVIVQVVGHGGGAVLADAAYHGASRQRMLAALRRGAVWPAVAGAWESACLTAPPPADGPLADRLIDSEQSNTSMVFGDQLILKLFRRLEVGDNPDVEIGAYLTAAKFSGTPPLIGCLRFTDDAGRRYDAALLQAFVPHARDAWGYAVEQLTAWLRGGAAGPPPFADDAAHLGRVTYALHQTLARAPMDAFVSRPAGPDAVAAWVQALQQRAETAWEMLAGHLGDDAPWPAESRGLASRLLDRRRAIAQDIARIGATLQADAGTCIRHHGDYHLGQVLRTADGAFKILDFEGEPLRPMADRRARHSPLRDVAGMLRSFAYAAATAGAFDGARPADVAQATRRWQAAVEGAYLQAYLQASRDDRGAALLPRDAEAVRQLVRLFTLEKAFYELCYELSHRPTWVGIPLRGLATQLGEPI